MISKKSEHDLREFFGKKEKSVIFVHNKEFVESLLAFNKSLKSGQYIIIPTSVDVLFALDERGIPYKIPEDYFSPDEYRDYAEKIEPRIINFTAEIDKQLKYYFLKIKQAGLELAFWHLYPFVRMFYPLTDAYFKIKKIIDKERPSKIGLLAKEGKVEINDGMELWLLWESDENIFSKVLREFQTEIPVHYFFINGKSSTVKNFFINWHKRIVKCLFQNKPRAYYFLRALRNNWRLSLNIFAHRLKLAPLLLLNSGYDWDLCTKDMYRRGFYIWGQVDDVLANWRGYKIEPGLSETILNKLENSPSFRESFRDSDIDFFPIVKRKINLFLEKIVPAALSAHQRTQKIIKENQIKGLLFSVNPTAISKSIAFTAKKLGISVIGWQHGDMNYKSIKSLALNDLLICDVFLGWGEGANNNLLITAGEFGKQKEVRTVGSASLDKIATTFSPGRANILKKIGFKNIYQPVVVYATTLYHLSNTYDLFFPPWSDNYLYQVQRKIIEGLSLTKGLKIVKLHPNLFYALPALEEYCQNFKNNDLHAVRNSINASLLFSIADAIVIDMPGTTILQAIACKKPVFCLTSRLKLDANALKMLGKRAVISDEPELLVKEVEYFIETGIYKADLNNNEFLENFGTNSDHNAVERAVDNVAKVISKI